MRCVSSGRPTRLCCWERCASINNGWGGRPSWWQAMPGFTQRKTNGRHVRWECSGSRSRIVRPRARRDGSTKGNAGSARGKNGGRGAKAGSACSNGGTGETAAGIGGTQGWKGGSDSGWLLTRSSIWEEFWQAGGVDKAVRHPGETKLPSEDRKSPGQHQRTLGQGPDLSGITLGTPKKPFLRQKVATTGGSELRYFTISTEGELSNVSRAHAERRHPHPDNSRLLGCSRHAS